MRHERHCDVNGQSLSVFPKASLKLVVPCLVSVVSDSATLWTGARQAPPSMGILQARILECIATPSSKDLPNLGIEPRFPTLQVDYLPAEVLKLAITDKSLFPR